MRPHRREASGGGMNGGRFRVIILTKPLDKMKRLN